MTQERTFLDTNIIVDRKLRKKEVIAKIESVIHQMFKYCSVFVFYVHKKAFLKAMQFLRTIFNKEILIQFSEALKKDFILFIIDWNEFKLIRVFYDGSMQK